MPKEFRGEIGGSVSDVARRALAEANASGVATVINFGVPVTVNPGDDLEEVTERAFRSQSM